MRMTTGCEPIRADWLGDRRVSWLWPAALAGTIAGWLVVPGAAGALLAAGSLAVAGALCVGNAIRCRRVHCAVTGPLYLLCALLFLAKAGGWEAGGGWIVAAAAAGTVIAYVPEWAGKRYVGEPLRGRLATAGTLVAAGLVAACCLGPALFVVFGVSVASLAALGTLHSYRWVFLLAGLACWLAAYRQRGRAMVACAEEVCGTRGSRRVSGIALWGSLAILIAAAVYPYVIVLAV
jgi:mercuric ion transport protein